MNYNIFGYHKSPVLPVQPTTEKIFGLELEISDEYVDDILEEMIGQNILTVPFNEDETQNLICLEDDGSVEYEIIFRADYKENLTRRVRTYFQDLAEVTDNHTGTSAHVHLSRDYLDTRGINELDILKAAEFLYPLLFEISGRSEEAAEEWATSYIGHQEARTTDWHDRAEKTDQIRGTPGSRYWCVNTRNANTIELRIFSNYRAFNAEYISAFLDSADIIIDIAEYMRPHRYIDKYQEILKIYLDFMKAGHRTLYDYHLDGKVLSAKELADRQQLNRYKKAARRINTLEYDAAYFVNDPLRTSRDIIYLMMDHPELKGANVGTTAAGVRATLEELRQMNTAILRRYYVGY